MVNPDAGLLAVWSLFSLIFLVSAIRSYCAWLGVRDVMILCIAMATFSMSAATGIYALIRSPLPDLIDSSILVNFSRILIGTAAFSLLAATDVYIASQHKGRTSLLDRLKGPLERYYNGRA